MEKVIKGDSPDTFQGIGPYVKSFTYSRPSWSESVSDLDQCCQEERARCALNKSTYFKLAVAFSFLSIVVTAILLGFLLSVSPQKQKFSSAMSFVGSYEEVVSDRNAFLRECGESLPDLTCTSVEREGSNEIFVSFEGEEKNQGDKKAMAHSMNVHNNNHRNSNSERAGRRSVYRTLTELQEKGLKLKTRTLYSKQKHENMDLKSTMTGMEAKKVSYEKDMKYMKESIRDLKATVTDMEAKISSAKEEMKKKNDSIADLKATVIDMKAKISSAKEETKEKDNSIVDLKSTIEDLQANKISMEEQKESMEKELQNMKVEEHMMSKKSNVLQTVGEEETVNWNSRPRYYSMDSTTVGSTGGSSTDDTNFSMPINTEPHRAEVFLWNTVDPHHTICSDESDTAATRPATFSPLTEDALNDHNKRTTPTPTPESPLKQMKIKEQVSPSPTPESPVLLGRNPQSDPDLFRRYATSQ